MGTGVAWSRSGFEQARAVDRLEVDLRADERGGLPGGDEREPGGERTGVDLAERKSTVLDLDPEVALIGLFRVEVALEQVDDLLRGTDDPVELLAVAEEALVVVAGLQGLGGRPGCLRIGQHAGGHECLGKLRRTRGDGLERLVVRTFDGLHHAMGVVLGDPDLRHRRLERVQGELQLHLGCTELPDLERDDILDVRVGVEELDHAVRDGCARRHRDVTTDIAGWLMVDTAHGGYPLVWLGCESGLELTDQALIQQVE